MVEATLVLAAVRGVTLMLQEFEENGPAVSLPDAKLGDGVSMCLGCVRPHVLGMKRRGSSG